MHEAVSVDIAPLLAEEEETEFVSGDIYSDVT
jgi:hypothetical protein